MRAYKFYNLVVDPEEKNDLTKSIDFKSMLDFVATVKEVE